MKLSDVVLLATAEPEVPSNEAIVAAAAANVFTSYGYDFDLSDDQRVADVHEGARFRIPLLLPEEIETGDSRKFTSGSVDIRDLPIPLKWQMFTVPGHDWSAVVGRIDHVERVEGGIGNAYGVFDTGPYGRECERLVRNRMLRGVSADLDKFEASVKDSDDDIAEIKALADGEDDLEEIAEELEKSKDKKIKNDEITVTKGRITAATVVATPAFQEVYIELDEEASYPEIELGDAVYEEVLDEPEALSAALVAAGAPVIPPRDWFNNPKLNTLTPITVTDDGHVYGHIASWNVSHIGLPGNTKPPRSRSNYAYFRTGVIRTDTGDDVPVGQLTLAGGHAPLHASAADAVKHYDDTASAMADVTAGEDAYGIWVSGALRPDATPEQVRALRASAPSGDWRPINNRLELVAVCQVNVPGFPVARACVASGSLTALVAAGARPLAELRQSELAGLEARLAELEAAEFTRQRALAQARMRDMIVEHDTAMVASAKERLRALSEDA